MDKTRKITVAPGVYGYWLDPLVWKVKRDGRAYHRVTGELWVHPDQARLDEEIRARAREYALERRSEAEVAQSTGKAKVLKGTQWVAERLGVSRQRASKLLTDGRIVGARRNETTGEWDLSHLVSFQVRGGKRGPRLRAHDS